MPNILKVMFEAIAQVRGPLTFLAFLAVILAFTIRQEKIAEALTTRLGLDRRSYFRLMILGTIILFAIAVFALTLSIQAAGIELFVLIGSALFLTVVLIGFASQVMKDKAKAHISEIILTGNVYWDSKDSGLEGIPDAELRVTGLHGDWKTLGGGYFEIPIRSSIYTSKKHEITVIVSNPPHVKPVTITTRKTRGITIKVPHPPQNISPTSNDDAEAPKTMEESNEKDILKEKQRMQIYLQGNFNLLTKERQSAMIDALAGLLKIAPQEIEVYMVRKGSIIFDVGIPPEAAQRLRSLLQTNSTKLRLLKVEKVIWQRESGQIEEWVIQEGKFVKPEGGHGVGTETSGRSVGVVFHGDHVTVGGDIVGRDKVVHGDEVRGDRVEGDKIEGLVGDVGSGAQVAIGKQINQTTTQASMELIDAEHAEIERLLAELKNQLASLDIPESHKLVGQEFVRQLEQELTKTDEPPDASTIKVAGNWLLDKIPALTGTVTSLFLNPTVGKMVEAAGGIATQWVKERFGG